MAQAQTTTSTVQRKHHDALSVASKRPHASSLLVDSKLTKSGNKKRVRRIHVELSHCREQVQSLELQLTLCQLKRSSASVQQSQNESTHFGDERHKIKGGDLWNGVAERQLKERLRAEKQQQKLIQSQSETTQFYGELKKLLEQWGSSGNLAGLMGSKRQLKFWNLAVEDEVFSELLVTGVRIYLEMRQRFEGPSRAMYLNADLSMGKDVARLDPSVKAGVVFDRCNGFLLPFNLDVVVEAYWRFFHCDQSTRLSMEQTDELSANSFTRSFSVRTDFKGFTSKVQGKYACRKYMETDSAVLTWAGLSDVLQFGSVEFRGMQLHKQGCIKLRKVPCIGTAQNSTLTVVETHFKTTPVFLENIMDQKQQTKSLIDCFESSYSKVNNMFLHIMGELLLQEDWKAMFGRVAY